MAIGITHGTNVDSDSKIFDIDGNGKLKQSVERSRHLHSDIFRTKRTDIETRGMEYFANGNTEIFDQLQAIAI